MEKFKVKVTNASEVLEIENILSKIGLGARDYSGFSYPKYIANNIDGEFSDYTMFDSGIDEFKLLTINELKDMVVLMWNDVGDANYTCDREKKYYVAGDDVYMYVVQGEWSLCKNLTLEKAIEVWGLKPIKEEAMKESLNDKIATAEVARQESKNIDATLAERQSQYGSFEDVAFVTENIMTTLANVRSNGLQDLPHTHRMALYMIASKMARIVNGDFNHLDGWHDIGGYSKLIEDLIGDGNEI